MGRRIMRLNILLPVTLWAATVFAEHGPLVSTQRDAWIDRAVGGLAASGLAPAPGKPVDGMTNLEVARWTARVSETLLAKAEGGAADPPVLSPRAAGDLERLVKEFRIELAGMEVDLARLGERIRLQRRRAGDLEGLQREYLKRTGTVINGYSRGYAFNFRGAGKPGASEGGVAPGPVYGPMAYNSALFVEMDLKSIPVPNVLFDTRWRYWRTVGMYYADPLGSSTNLDLRWISLSYYNDVASLTAGDFYRSYTPLTLWNHEAPVQLFLEPTPMERERRDVEETVFMDRGPDWHLRGFQAFTSKDRPRGKLLSGFQMHAMGGSLQTPSDSQFGAQYGGSRLSTAHLDGKLKLEAQGLLMRDDPGSADIPYVEDFSKSWAREYRVGSLSGGVSIPLKEGMSAGASLEYARSVFLDDVKNSARSFRDWAVLANGSFDLPRFHATAKVLRVDPYFYSPGAQTSRYSAVPLDGYMSTGGDKDEYLYGYLDRFPLKGVNRPSFAVYDRLRENALPYGDATPNRRGILLGFSADHGKEGWLKSQASYIADLREIQPNHVLAWDGSRSQAVDGAANTAVARVFGGFEAALKADLARLAGLEGSTHQAGVDVKRQTATQGPGAKPFTVDTFLMMLDFNPPISGFDNLLGSVAFETARSRGSEYVLTGRGSPPTYAAYPFYLDTESLGSYTRLPLGITRTTWVFGLNYPLSPTLNLRGSYFLVHYKWREVPDFDRQDRIWRVTYEASF